ncbi:hypothetical protein GCM10009851_19960 [Herbiconiux moechotypicola]|uniref:Cyclodeaminase/cyclohydrolase domain-containing protein n=1 Tax=Herbiconiux moechotypicola TaxID=637393 RepID=A0ABP5QJK0_9MICO
MMLAFAASLAGMVAGYSAPAKFEGAPVGGDDGAATDGDEGASSGCGDGAISGGEQSTTIGADQGAGGRHGGWEAARRAVAERVAALREKALQLADSDAEASGAFSSAFALPPGTDHHHAAVRVAALGGARSSAALGGAALALLPDLDWLSREGNPAVAADVAVAHAALRAALTGARTNLSADLALYEAAPPATAATAADADLSALRDTLAAMDAALTTDASGGGHTSA